MYPKNSSLETMFTIRFLRDLACINCRRSSSSSSSAANIIKRSRRIKLAADASMASSVGTKRAWSRALLRKLRIQARPHAIPMKTKIAIAKKKKSAGSQRTEKSPTDKLRSLVPGGHAMDFCSLLDETADYIRCLTTQVQVMQSIADSLSL